jgi:hypothetical protein
MTSHIGAWQVAERTAGQHTTPLMIEPEKSTHDIDVRMTVSDLGNADEEAVRSPAATSAEGQERR